MNSQSLGQESELLDAKSESDKTQTARWGCSLSTNTKEDSSKLGEFDKFECDLFFATKASSSSSSASKDFFSLKQSFKAPVTCFSRLSSRFVLSAFFAFL